MGNEIDRSLSRLEASTKIRELANDIQLANGRLLGYAATLAGGDDHAIDEAVSRSIRACARISDKAHLLRDVAECLEKADKDEARLVEGDHE